MNERFQNALQRIPQNTPPVWFMRQAGRYHRHYQALKETHSFMDLCLQPALAAEVARGPVADFDFDVAILFSDLLFPLDAMGMGLSYPEGGPKLEWHVREDNLAYLKRLDEALPKLQFQKDAVVETRKVLPEGKSLIGFVGGPFTLFAYAVEGTHGKGLIETKKRLDLFEPFCVKLLPLLRANIELQLAGGAEVVMLFDTAAGELSPAVFRDLVVPQLRKLSERLGQKLGYYSKGTQPAHLDHDLFLGGGFRGIGVDHRFDIRDAFQIGSKGFVQGNFDEAMLFLDAEAFEREVARYLEPLRALSPEARAGWVCGLGHGVLPKTPEENVRTFVKRIREVFA